MASPVRETSSRPDAGGRQAGILSAGDAFRLLTEATDLLVQAPDYDTGLHLLTQSVVPSMADLTAIYVLGGDARLHPRAVTARGSGGSADLTERLGSHRSLEQGDAHPVALCARSRRPVLCFEGDAGSETVEEMPPDPDRFASGVGGVAVPLVARGERIGVLYMALDPQRPDGRRYGLHDLVFATELAARVALVLDNQVLLREAQEARQAKGDFLAVMSHELRTPLTAVVGYADLLEAGIAGPVNEGQVLQLQRIKESAWELLELIDGILGYARFEGEEPEVVVEQVETADLLDDVMAAVRSTMREKGLGFFSSVDPDVPPLLTDRSKARRILFHLVDNAVKFTEEGEVGVDVTSDDAWIRFHVRDTGSGIRQRHLEHIFEPFWQGQRAETRTTGGTGMGLSLARRLAHVLDGEIRVRSRLGEGSVFTLLLPRRGPSV